MLAMFEWLELSDWGWITLNVFLVLLVVYNLAAAYKSYCRCKELEREIDKWEDDWESR